MRKSESYCDTLSPEFIISLLIVWTETLILLASVWLLITFETISN